MPHLPRADRERLVRRLLVGADFAAGTTAAALLAQGAGRGALLVGALVVLAGVLSGLYRRGEVALGPATRAEARSVFGVATLGTLAAWLAADAAVAGADALLLWIALAATLFAARRGAHAIGRRAGRDIRVLLAGDAAAHERLAAALEGTGTELAGRTDPRREPLADAVARVRADRVVIDSRALPHGEMCELLHAAHGAGIGVSLLKRVLDEVGPEAALDDLGGLVLVGVRR